MNAETAVVWLLRLFTAAAVLGPLASYYLAAGSLNDFLVPSFTPPPSPPDPSSLRVTSVSHGEGEGVYLLRVRLLNEGGVGVGLKEMSGRVSAPSLGVSGGFVLRSPFTLEPGEEEEVLIAFLLEEGSPEGLQRLVSEHAPVDLSAEAILVVGSAELPLRLSLKGVVVGGLGKA